MLAHLVASFDLRFRLRAQAASSYCAPVDAVGAPSGDHAPSVTVAVQPSRGRLVALRRPKELTRGARRTRALGRVKKIRRPRVKTERRAQRKAPKVRDERCSCVASDAAGRLPSAETALTRCMPQNGEKPTKKIVRRVTFVKGV